MFGVLHRSFVWTIVAALIAGGATWRQCIAEHLPAATAANAQHSHSAGHHEHHQHHDADTAGNQAADDSGPPARANHACLRCCTMCTVSSIVPPSPSPAAIFTMSALLFAVEHDCCSGRIILIDPGIPKRIA